MLISEMCVRGKVFNSRTSVTVKVDIMGGGEIIVCQNRTKHLLENDSCAYDSHDTWN